MSRYTYQALDTFALSLLQLEGDVLRHPPATRLTYLIEAQDRFCDQVPGTYIQPAGWSVTVPGGQGYVALPDGFTEVWPNVQAGVLASIGGRWGAIPPISRATALSDRAGGQFAFATDRVAANAQGWFIEGDYFFAWPYVNSDANYLLFGYGSPPASVLPTSATGSGDTDWSALYPVLRSQYQIALAYGEAHILSVREQGSMDDVWSVETDHLGHFNSIVKSAKGASARTSEGLARSSRPLT